MYLREETDEGVQEAAIEVEAKRNKERKERNEGSKKKTIQETKEVEVSKPLKGPTEVPFIEDVATEVRPINVLEVELEEDSEDSATLRTKKRKGKIIISDSESTYTEGYAKASIDQTCSIPFLIYPNYLLSMLS